MSARLEKMVDELIRREGGYIDHPDDPGGATKYGISLRKAETVGDNNRDGWLDFDLDRDGDVDRDDIKLIDIKDAREFFLLEYFYGPHIEWISDTPPLWEIMFDMAVNFGKRRAILLLQRTLTHLDFSPGPPDGIIGSKTVDAASAALEKLGSEFIRVLVTARCLKYCQIAFFRPVSIVFLRGWLNRALEFMPKG